jgi:hypothetical protein
MDFSELPVSVEWIIIYVFIALAILVPIIAIVDVLKSKFKRPYDKAIWLLLIIFLNLLGAILYFSLSRERKKPKA